MTQFPCQTRKGTAERSDETGLVLTSPASLALLSLQWKIAKNAAEMIYKEVTVNENTRNFWKRKVIDNKANR